MTDLAEFLMQRIAEDEADARDASHRDAEWTAVDPSPAGWGADERDAELLGGGKPLGRFDPEYGGMLVAEHVARWSPARVLAECAAKRRIVELHRGQKALWDDDENPLEVVECPECGVLFPCPTLRLLALPYADHPDYREEWRP